MPLRYPAKRRDAASVQRVRGTLSECGIEDLAVCNAVDREAAWSRAGVHAIGLLNASDCWVRNVHSYPAEIPEHEGHHLQGGGIVVGDSKCVTIADCRMEMAQNRGGGGAGYLFEITRSNEILN